MEDGENSGGIFDSSYNKLIYQEDTSGDEDTLYPSQRKQQVSMSMVRPESSLDHYKVLTISLAVLAVILLMVDIGLGVYYRKLTAGQDTIMDISREVAKLQATYNTAVQSRDEVKRQLAKEISEQQLTKWELEHEITKSKTYKTQSEKIQMEIAAMKSHIPMIEEGCRHCLPGWTFMNSMCYYFAFSDVNRRMSWQEARQFCTRQGGDLVVIDSREKQMAIRDLINKIQGTTAAFGPTGFWIGLTDVQEEGMWKWVDGTRLTEGYWAEGEPNNMGNEDCAAIYPRANPFRSWNDAPCSYGLKWICQKTPT